MQQGFIKKAGEWIWTQIIEYKTLVIMALYAIFYLLSFAYLENRDVTHYIIEIGIDRMIPFCEVFIIPYLLWFAYVAVTVCFICITEKEESKKLVAFLIAGMTIFIIISAVFPNGHNLRPDTFERDNIFTQLIGNLYSTDTSTNILPSIHVYNSIAIMIAVYRSVFFKKHKIISAAMQLLGAGIICSTVLIKQHSMVDVIMAIILSVFMYIVCYGEVLSKIKGTKLASADIVKD